MKRRIGTSLVELLAVIAAASVLIGLSAGLLRLLMDVGQSGEEHLARGMTLTRLGRQFRDDVRAATSVVRRQPEKPPFHGITLSLKDEQSVEYQVGERAVLRLHRSSSRQTQREAFPLPAGAQVEINTQLVLSTQYSVLSTRPPITEGGREFVALIMSRRTDRSAGGAGEYRVEAALGGDHRFERRGE